MGNTNILINITDCFIAQRYEDVVAENTVLREGPHKNAIFQTLY